MELDNLERLASNAAIENIAARNKVVREAGERDEALAKLKAVAMERTQAFAELVAIAESEIVDEEIQPVVIALGKATFTSPSAEHVERDLLAIVEERGWTSHDRDTNKRKIELQSLTVAFFVRAEEEDTTSGMFSFKHRVNALANDGKVKAIGGQILATESYSPRDHLAAVEDIISRGAQITIESAGAVIARIDAELSTMRATLDLLRGGSSASMVPAGSPDGGLPPQLEHAAISSAE